MTKTKDKLRSPEEIHASIRGKIKNMYADDNHAFSGEDGI